VVPLIERVFGIQPDAMGRTVVFEPQVPTGWEDMSIEDLPIGTNMVAFARAKTGRGIEYTFASRDPGWHFVLKLKDVPGVGYFVNGRPVPFSPSGIRMSGRTNRVLVVR